ncbi:MAG: hypothetical protein KAI24_24395, partial [Planctomycetes bacterium]|nr:hypothetical protein [Planctomycetota bacterium]
MNAPLLVALGALALAATPRAQVVFATDFEGGLPVGFAGAGVIESTQGFAVHGFGGSFLRNGSGCPPVATTLTLQNLPPHDVLELDFLLAIIDTWDGLEPCCGPDFFTVTVDGQVVFQESFQNAFGGIHPYAAPAGALLVQQPQLGFRSTNVNDLDSAFDLAHEAALSSIPHTGSSVTIGWVASG